MEIIHDNHIIHRDLKPEVLLVLWGYQGVRIENLDCDVVFDWNRTFYLLDQVMNQC